MTLCLLLHIVITVKLNELLNNYEWKHQQCKKLSIWLNNTLKVESSQWVRRDEEMFIIHDICATIQTFYGLVVSSCCSSISQRIIIFKGRSRYLELVEDSKGASASSPIVKVVTIVIVRALGLDLDNWWDEKTGCGKGRRKRSTVRFTADFRHLRQINISPIVDVAQSMS